MIRLFSLCEGMSWAHLPVAGGLYDQHPDFVKSVAYMLQKKNEAEAKRAKNEAAKSKGTRPKSRA